MLMFSGTAAIVGLLAGATPTAAQGLAQAPRLDLDGPRSWISNDNYPSEALRNREQGVVEVQLDISEKGRIENCQVVTSSGSRSLDEASCKMVARGPAYLPAKDELGKKIRAVVRRRIAWTLPR